ncbi:hypothetical protein [Streptosporangium sp. NPDC020145]|uniref:hypothetical protein n=1 Tax=Streptosporangium sp. NPDC020145 TaxID=3154694 RepID=UPI00341AD435
MRVDLPGGQWADLLEPSDMRSGDMKALNKALPIVRTTVGFMDEMHDVLLRRVITAWSLDLPLPRDLPGTEEESGSLDRLAIPVYRALVEAIQPHIALFSEDQSADPKPSPESAGTSKDSPSTSAKN